MTASPQTFTITPEQYAAMEARVNAAGVPIAGDSGTVHKDGATITWTYDGTNLTVAVPHSWPLRAEFVEAKIAEAINKALTS